MTATSRTTVHLRSAVADELDVDSPLEADAIDYYDSGIWVTHAAGRDFFPYDQLLAIRERETAPADAPGADVEPAPPEAN